MRCSRRRTWSAFGQKSRVYEKAFAVAKIDHGIPVSPLGVAQHDVRGSQEHGCRDPDTAQGARSTGSRKKAMQKARVLAQFGQRRGKWCATLGMPLAARHVYFTVGRLHVYEKNCVRSNDSDIDLEPLSIVAAQLKVVQDAVPHRQMIAQIRNGLSLGVVRRLSDGDDLRHSSLPRSFLNCDLDSLAGTGFVVDSLRSKF